MIQKLIKKNILSLMFFTILIQVSMAQNYYWNDGKKVSIRQDYSSFVYYYDESAKESISLTSEDIQRISSHRDIAVGSYKIIKLKRENPILFKQLDSFKIKNKSYGIIVEDGDTVYQTNAIVLQLKKGYAKDNVYPYLEKYEGTITSSEYNVIRIALRDISKVLLCANEIYESGIADWCHPDFLIKVVLNDNWEKQYYLNNTNHDYCGFNHDLDVVEAWKITTGCNDIRVAVIDDGVEDHPDLRDENGDSRVLPGYTPSGSTQNGRPGLNDEHGESCAGIIAASHSTEIKGIAPKVKIVPVKLDLNTAIPASTVANGINWAWNPSGGNADILSNSWGGSNHDIVKQAIRNAQLYGRGGNINTGTPGLGAVVVFASGNDGANEVSSYAKEAIAVGALNKYDQPANLNGNRYTNIGVDQDLVAYGGDVTTSGGDIRTLDRVGSNGYTTGNYYDGFSGTSAACPQVSGTAALILSVNPNLTRTEVENILYTTATDLGTSGRDNTYGYGKVNAFRAVQKAIESRGKPFTPNTTYLTLTKIRSDFKTIFSGAPYCNVVSGTYFCDVYQATQTFSYTTDWVWYIGDGLSGANPNNGQYYSHISTSSGATTVTTFFYYIKTNTIGQTINQWVPRDPNVLANRTVLINPPADITLSSGISSGSTVSYLASNSIRLLPNFHAVNGVNFVAKTTSNSNDIFCLPNPAMNHIALKSTIQIDSIEDNVFPPLNYRITNTDMSVYPNPSKGNFKLVLHISIIPDAWIYIYDIRGKLVLQEKMTSNEKDMTLYDSGIYIVKLVNENKVYSNKLVIKK